MLAAFVGATACLSVYAAVAVCGRGTGGRGAVDRRGAARRLRELRGEHIPDPPEPAGEGGWLRKAVSRLGNWVTPGAGRGVDDLQACLTLAGYREPSAGRYFTGIRLVLVVLLAAGAGLAAGFVRAPWPRVATWAVVGGAAGFVAPSVVLGSQVKKRQGAIRTALPDALDILVLSVEGGVSLNAALMFVTDEIQGVHPVLGGELAVVQKEMQLGLSAGEAFRAFAGRCGIPEARDLAAALVQSEKYGASVAKALRAYADSARQDRQVWAEEVAQKAAVKILFPMLLFILPAMFIVLLGPAATQMSRLFAR